MSKTLKPEFHNGKPVVDLYHFHDMEESKSYDIKVPRNEKRYEELRKWIFEYVGDEKDNTDRWWLEDMFTEVGVDELLINEIPFQQ
tara:strand:- start:47 stop:304 length:258 start_codon:yes stop_codon:yes gene_type:complete